MRHGSLDSWSGHVIDLFVLDQLELFYCGTRFVWIPLIPWIYLSLVLGKGA